ncbi:MAG: FHA domain-containing protein [Rhodopirellula sp.]|nr:FHA domain-containing protein [Rhodopirellula sp.]
MAARLIIMTGKHQGKKMALAEGCKLVIGRDEGVAVRLATSEVSRRHCAIRVREGVVSVEDLGSRNGTQINDVTIIKRTKLRHGDILRVGPMLFEFQDKAKAIAASGTKTSPEIESETDEINIRESSEDSIVNWLTEEEPAASDTDTVVGKTAPTAELSAADSGMTSDDDDKPSAAVEPDIPPPAKKEFRSIAEEAQDIIRRHLEMKSR